MKKPGTIVVALVLIVLGLGSILWREHLAKGSWLDPYLGEISSALLAGGVLSMLYKTFTEREQREELRHLFGIHKSVEEAGLDEVLAASQNYDFTDFLRRNTAVSLVMNDGERWIGNYAVALRERFSKAGCSTVVFTLDPNGIGLTSLARKVGKTDEEQRAKVRNAWNLLSQVWNASSKHGNLRIYRLLHYPTHSIFLGDTEAIITLYQVSGGRTNVPVMIVKDVERERSFFSFVKRDIEGLQQESIEEPVS